MTMLKLNYQRTKFIMSSPSISKLPVDNGLEVAFVGVSNAGKSSLLNALCNQKSLAKTSSTPGRTQLINLFAVAPYVNLVDLPGYGYAAVPEKLKIEWQKSLGTYLEKREYLAGIVLLMDARHPLKPLDQQMLQWCVEFSVPVVVVLTKTDKLTQQELMKQIRLVNEALIAFTVASEENPDPEPIKVIPVSSVKKRGLDKLAEVLDLWFDPVTSKYEEMGITDLTPPDKSHLVIEEQEEVNGGYLSQALASKETKGKTTKQRYSPTARRLGTSKPFVDPKKLQNKSKRYKK
ncbi:hypothetical protein CKF59_07140 [Psittacicella gerlachiana]|uniref:Probable GTP-binding protein EngB n=1 Tax=Psittacicella gerlachiana TaxID=2028574 RepID=A0A3A1Y4J2_9GAMM|nr:hypothetical protein CKF59_07140 [Psittacicella gerlachiana]